MNLGKYSIGIGDRFSHQGKAQLRAIMKANESGVNISPVWNKSNREHMYVNSRPEDVRQEADNAVRELNFKGQYFVDADHINNLIEKDEVKISKLSDDDKEKLKTEITESINNKSYTIQLEDLSGTDAPFIITQSEFMRRMKDMQASGGAGMFGMGNFPEMYNVVVNANSDLATEILAKDSKEEKDALINQALDLAKLSQGLLKGKELTNFINRSFKNIK